MYMKWQQFKAFRLLQMQMWTRMTNVALEMSMEIEL